MEVENELPLLEGELVLETAEEATEEVTEEAAEEAELNSGGRSQTSLRMISCRSCTYRASRMGNSILPVCILYGWL